MECEQQIKLKLSTDAEMFISISGFGTFSRADISVLHRYQEIADLRIEIEEDRRWISNDNTLTSDEQEAVLAIVEGSRLHEVIVRHGNLQVDSKTLSTLFRETYLDTFVMDYLGFKFLSLKQKTTTLYLPYDSWKLSQTRDNSFFERILQNYSCIPDASLCQSIKYWSL